jgi:hypothetical protein
MMAYCAAKASALAGAPEVRGKIVHAGDAGTLGAAGSGSDPALPFTMLLNPLNPA